MPTFKDADGAERSYRVDDVWAVLCDAEEGDCEVRGEGVGARFRARGEYLTAAVGLRELGLWDWWKGRGGVRRCFIGSGG